MTNAVVKMIRIKNVKLNNVVNIEVIMMTSEGLN